MNLKRPFWLLRRLVAWKKRMKLILSRGLRSSLPTPPVGRSNWMKKRADQIEMEVGLGRNMVW